VDGKTPTGIKETAHKTTSKAMPPPPEIHQTPVFNVEKWDTLPGTVQSVVQIANIIGRPT